MGPVFQFSEGWLIWLTKKGWLPPHTPPPWHRLKNALVTMETALGVQRRLNKVKTGQS